MQPYGQPPPQQYGPPPGYPAPPVAPQYAQPSYTYGAPQHQPPQQYTPQQAPAAQMPTFIAPPPPGAQLAPKIYFLEGCLVALNPVRFTKAGTEDNLTGFGKDDPKDRVTVDIYLLETPGGQPIAFGGEQDNGGRLVKPNTHTVTGPARFMGVWLNNGNIVRAVAPGGVLRTDGMLLGRIVRSDVGGRPWNLADVTGTPDFDRAVAAWTQAASGNRWVEPNPIPTQQYVPPTQQAYAPSPVPPAPTAWAGQYPTQQQMAPAGPPPGYGAPAEQIQQWAGAPPAAPAPQGPPAPPGWNPTTWANMPPEAQQQVLSSIEQANQMPQQYAPQAPAGPPANPWGNAPQ